MSLLCSKPTCLVHRQVLCSGYLKVELWTVVSLLNTELRFHLQLTSDVVSVYE